MDNDIKLHPEEERKEFGYFPFEELPPVTTHIVEKIIQCEIGSINLQHTDPVQIDIEITLLMKDEQLIKLQECNSHIKQLRKMCTENSLNQNIYTMENNILKRKLINNRLLFMPIVVPNILRDCLLILSHDKSGHNGFRRTYSSLKNRYYWKGMKKSVHQHCASCQVCAKHNIKTQQIEMNIFHPHPNPWNSLQWT